MSTAFTLDTIPADQATDTILGQAATLFSSAYGVWSPEAEHKIGKYCKQGTLIYLQHLRSSTLIPYAGQHIRISVERLRRHYLAPGTNSVLVRGMVGDKLAGHASATRWMHKGRQICWITQLCVSPEYRRRGLATQILRRLREAENDWCFGILSSSPAAIMAALRAYCRGIEEVSFDVVREHGADIMAASPVKYVREAKLKGSVFGIEDGTVCCADTNFWVDHTEPLDILAEVKKKVIWPFGELPEGCEFLALFKGAETILSI